MLVCYDQSNFSAVSYNLIIRMRHAGVVLVVRGFYTTGTVFITVFVVGFAKICFICGHLFNVFKFQMAYCMNCVFVLRENFFYGFSCFSNVYLNRWFLWMVLWWNLNNLIDFLLAHSHVPTDFYSRYYRRVLTLFKSHLVY